MGLSGPLKNAVMDNRNRFLVAVNAEVFRRLASKTEGCFAVLDHAKNKLGYMPSTLGAEKAISEKDHLPLGFSSAPSIPTLRHWVAESTIRIGG